MLTCQQNNVTNETSIVYLILSFQRRQQRCTNGKSTEQSFEVNNWRFGWCRSSWWSRRWWSSSNGWCWTGWRWRKCISLGRIGWHHWEPWWYSKTQWMQMSKRATHSICIIGHIKRSTSRK